MPKTIIPSDGAKTDVNRSHTNVYEDTLATDWRYRQQLVRKQLFPLIDQMKFSAPGKFYGLPVTLVASQFDKDIKSEAEIRLLSTMTSTKEFFDVLRNPQVIYNFIGHYLGSVSDNLYSMQAVGNNSLEPTKAYWIHQWMANRAFFRAHHFRHIPF